MLLIDCVISNAGDKVSEILVGMKKVYKNMEEKFINFCWWVGDKTPGHTIISLSSITKTLLFSFCLRIFDKNREREREKKSNRKKTIDTQKIHYWDMEEEVGLPLIVDFINKFCKTNDGGGTGDVDGDNFLFT